MRKRIMIIGPQHSGKSELISYIEDEKLHIIKDSMFYKKKTIYVPSSYIECPWMYKHILSVQQQANLVIMMLDEKRIMWTYPPNLAYQFKMPVIGVIVLHERNPSRIKDCENELLTTGVQKIFYIDFHKKATFEKFADYLSTQKIKD